MLQAFARRLNESRKDERGFTLVEILVVVIIIGILAAIAIPTFLGMQERAYNATAANTVRNAATAAKAYFAENQTYDGMTAAALDNIEPSLPDGENTAPYAPGTYTVTETDNDFQITVRHPRGTKTFIADNTGTAEAP